MDHTLSGDEFLRITNRLEDIHRGVVTDGTIHAKWTTHLTW